MFAAKLLPFPKIKAVCDCTGHNHESSANKTVYVYVIILQNDHAVTMSSCHCLYILYNVTLISCIQFLFVNILFPSKFNRAFKERVDQMDNKETRDLM